MKINNLKKKNLNFFKVKNTYIILFCLITYILGMWTERYHFKNTVRDLFYDTVETFSNKIYLNFYAADKFKIDIKFKDYQKILDNRNQSLKDNRVTDDVYKWVDAVLIRNNKSHKIKIKLKGVHEDHWSHPFKWSFKIKLEDENIFGLRRFSIQHPETRGYLFEWLFMKALKKEKLISHRIEYINPIINGNNYGIYLLEEQHSKELIENNQRREGPIIGFDKNLWIVEANNLSKLGINTIEDSFFRSEITPIQFKESKINTEQEIYLNKAISLLNDFRNKKKSLDKIFDVDQLAKVMALKAVLGAIEFDWRDLKFYYNPITNLLEPIAREVHVDMNQSQINKWWIDSSKENFAHSPDQSYFLNILYSDLNFYEKYLKNLSYMSKPNYLKSIITENHEEFKKYSTLLSRNNPVAKIFSEEYIEKYRKVISDTLNPVQGISVNYIQNNNNYLELSISNLQRLPIEIIGLKSKDDKLLSIKNRVIVQGKLNNEPTRISSVKIDCNLINCKKDSITDYKVIFKVLGQNQKKESIINFWNNNFNFKNLNENNENIVALKDLEYVKVSGKNILFNKGSWKINKRIIIPKNYNVTIPAGTKIIFQESGQIISFSPIYIKGLKEDNVYIVSDTLQKKNTEGNFLFVLETEQPSIIEYASFSNLSAPDFNKGTGITGAINFYNADVKIKNSRFEKNINGDDLLNIVRSNFSIKNSIFENAMFDAIDIDFGKGIISEIKIINPGNDGLDFSGSFVDLNNILIEKAGDKGISAGENSRVIVKDIKINSSKMGLVSKDKSNLFAESVNIENTKIGFSTYQKKPEFGSAQIIAEKVTLKNVVDEYISQENSIIKVDEKIIANYNCKKKLEKCEFMYD